jgi:Tfp pilus assembly protein PilX
VTRREVDNSREMLMRGTPWEWTARNGVIPNGHAAAQLAGQLNALLARGRVLFSQYVVNSSDVYDTNTTTDATTMRFACHTGPLASKVRVTYYMEPAGGAFASGDSYAYWVTETGLSGSGTSTTRASVFNAEIESSSSTFLNSWYSKTQEFSVDPDTDYRFTLHQSNRFGIRSVTVCEIPRTIITDADANYVADEIAVTGQVFGSSVTELFAGAEKLWKRGGHPLVQWTRASTTSVTRTTNTAVNIDDSTVTTVTADSPGYYINVPYSGTLDSTGVGVMAYLHATCTGGTGVVEFKNQAGTVLATFNVTSADSWQGGAATPFTDAGGTETTKIDIHITGPGGADTLSVNAAGLFMYVA